MNNLEIKELRVKLKLSQSDFAGLVGATSKMTISGWESGKRKPDRYFSEKLTKLKKKIEKD